jgi:PIN domain nuclease of toxin-antitoxin system
LSKFVLDSSALLAYLNAEPGGDAVEPLLQDAMISAVNVAEIVGRLIARSKSIDVIREIFDILDLDIVDFDRAYAEKTGELVEPTKADGLSLGDRACLALAGREKLPAVTADKAWAKLNVGIEIKLIR